MPQKAQNQPKLDHVHHFVSLQMITFSSLVVQASGQLRLLSLLLPPLSSTAPELKICICLNEFFTAGHKNIKWIPNNMYMCLL